MADTEVKTLITVKADTAQAAAEMKKLAAATDATTASLKKQTEQAGLVGNKFSELGKSMVGLQMHDTFTKASKAVDEYTGGIVDLTAAYAGYQVAGPYGAAIGANGGAAVKSAGVLSGFGSEMNKVWEEAERSKGPLYDYKKNLENIEAAARQTTYGLLIVEMRFAQGRKVVDLATQQLAGYNSVVSSLTRGLGNLSKAAPDAIAMLVRVGLGKDQWSGGIKFKSGGSGEESDAARAARLRRSMGDRYTDWTPGASGRVGSLGARADENVDELGIQRDPLGDVLRGQSAAKTKSWNDRLGANRANHQSFMEQKFGPVGQFDAYATAFQGFSGAVVSGYDAMVDGTMSFGAAFKKSIAGALKALGGQMLVESLKETAYGVAAIASGYGFAAAAPHFKSAALFGAAAVAAGVAAHGLGGGGGSTASASAPNVGSSGASSSLGQATTQTIIVYGDALAENSPRGQQVLAKKIIQKALGSTAVEAS